MSLTSVFKKLTFIVLVLTVGVNMAKGEQASRGKVLVVLSAADSIPLREGSIHSTGIFLGEIVEPVEAILSAGYEVVYVSPGGVAPTIDEDSRRLMYWKFNKKKLAQAEASLVHLIRTGMNSPLQLEDVANDEAMLDKFDAVFVPGGHGPLVDLYYKDMFASKELNSDMGKVLEFFHRKQRPTGLICHAPAALATAPAINGRWIYEGYKVTAISRLTEWMNEDMPGMRVIKGHVDEYPSDILRDAGAKFVYMKIPMIPFVVEDRELMTGQDPFSAGLMAKRFVEKLNKHVSAKTQP